MTQLQFTGLALAAGLVMLLTTAAESLAQTQRSAAPQKADPVQRAKGEPCAEGCCDECGGRRGRKGFGAQGSAASNREANFNCGCNGSYKFPVPPLSTYHWPGMYSIQLMTDYHSPWRFPPLRPYVDEPASDGTGRKVSNRRVNTASFDGENSVQEPAPTRTHRSVEPRGVEPRGVEPRGVEPLSAKLQRLYGTK